MKEMTHEETKQMVEKLKSNTSPYGLLLKDEQLFILINRHSSQIYISMWVDYDKAPSKFQHGTNINHELTYRLSPSFVLPEPVKERWFFNTKTKQISGLYHEYTEKDFWPEVGWIEITPEQKAYLETKPADEKGFEWVRKVPSSEWFMDLNGHECYGICVGNDINKIRWVKVPVKAEPRFVEYPITKTSGYYSCDILHTRCTVFIDELPSIVGFAGVRFDGKDGWFSCVGFVNSWNNDIPAAPIAARFYVEESK